MKSREIRVFSVDGINLLLMFSRQPIAKQFRQWLKGVPEQVQTKQPVFIDVAFDLHE